MKLDKMMFGVTFAIDNYQLDMDKSGKLLDYMTDKYGANLGMRIASNKKWETTPDDELLIKTLQVIVFTPEELRQYVKHIRGTI